ncbi:MAG: type II toxin-antitoxin system VapC family toxin [Candidatus Nitrosotenuis sp.]
MVCPDTDFLVAYLRNDSTVRIKLDLRDEPIYTTINAFEIYKGAHNAKNPSNEIVRVDNLLDAFYILTIDRDSAKTAGIIITNHIL